MYGLLPRLCGGREGSAYVYICAHLTFYVSVYVCVPASVCRAKIISEVRMFIHKGLWLLLS